MQTNQIISYFDSYLSLDATEKEELINRLSERKIKRRQFILQENDICKHFTFVVEGCFKMYAVDKNGYEHNLPFAAENDWIADIGSLYNEKPSQLYIEAIEPSLILQIAKKTTFGIFITFIQNLTETFV